MPQVQVIAPLRAQEPAKIKVCAYARVSSDSADQLNSFASQVRYYTNLISGNENWTLVDIYADRGITGTSTAKRTEFQRMMEDCRKGKIDRILVKSLSRFARNTQDCIAALRELRQLGVTVVFEKEHINTGTMANEMLISMMSAFAQEESVSISKNLRKAVQMRMQSGTYKTASIPFGYDRGNDGTYIINEYEAKIVRFIFSEFLSGTSMNEIAKSLQNRGVLRSDGVYRWYGFTVGYILRNEKYVGDEILGKSYKTESVPFRRVRNQGEKPTYYLQNVHPAIISRKEYEAVQSLLKQKSQKYYYADGKHSSKYMVPNILYCNVCGALFYRRCNRRGVEWVCGNHFHDASNCPSGLISEGELMTLFQRLIFKLRWNECKILKRHLAMLASIEVFDQNRKSVQRNHVEIAALSDQSHTLHRLWTAGCIDSAFFYEKEKKLQSAIHNIRQNILRDRSSQEKLLKIEATKSILQCVTTAPAHQFEPECFAKMVKKITVDNEKVVFTLYNGLELSESREGIK